MPRRKTFIIRKANTQNSKKESFKPDIERSSTLKKKHYIIKKYSNRRLYDTIESVYITLSQLYDIIKEGHIVQVIDVNTKEDVTSFILTQIILEQSKKNKNYLPVSLLHLLIQYGDNLLSDFFDQYLQKTLENYIAQKKAFNASFGKMLEFGMDFSGIAQKTIKDFEPFASLTTMFQEADTAKKSKKEK